MDQEKQKLYELKDKLENLRAKFHEAIEVAEDIARDANKCKGEISRVLGGQLEYYTIAGLKNYDTGRYQTGSISGLIDFIDDQIKAYDEVEED
jgi:hypothetical protein